MRILVFGIVCGVLGIALLISSYKENAPPEEVILERLTGVASHYGMNDGFHGKCMADGRIYNKNLMTAAHKSLPLGTKIRVTYLERSVELIITDRGPYKKGRIIDLSEAAARELGFIQRGIVPVVVEVLSRPSSSQKYHHDHPECLKDTPSEYDRKTIVAKSS